MWLIAIAACLVVVAVGYYIVSNGNHYKRLFAEESFREFHERLSRAIGAASDGPSHEPSVERETAFVTRAGLAAVVTLSPDSDGMHALHISLSEPGRVTTHAVCSRFGFLIVAMLRDNHAELSPWYGEAGVHHMRFRLGSPDVTIRSFGDSYAHYSDHYSPVPFCQQSAR